MSVHFRDEIRSDTEHPDVVSGVHSAESRADNAVRSVCRFSDSAGRAIAVPDTLPIRDYVAEFLRTHCDLEFDDIPPGATLDDLEVDSLTVLSIIVLVEKEYGLELPERRVAAARTFAELMDVLGVRIAAAP